MNDDQKAMEMRNCADLLRIVEERLGHLLQGTGLRDWERRNLAGAWDEVLSAKGLMDGME